MFLLVCVVALGTLYIYPECFSYVYALFVHNTYPVDRNLLDDLKFLVLVILAIPLWLVLIKEYICVLLDIKKNEQMTVKVKGMGKPELNFFDTHIPGSNRKEDIYYYWKAIDSVGKKYKFIVFSEENNLKGKTIKHSYNVTFYKYSKIVTNIEKDNSKTGDSTVIDKN